MLEITDGLVQEVANVISTLRSSVAARFPVIQENRQMAQSTGILMEKLNSAAVTEVLENEYLEIADYYTMIAVYYWLQGKRFATEPDAEISSLYDDFDEFCSLPIIIAAKERLFECLEVCSRVCDPEAQTYLHTIVDLKQKNYEYLFSFVLIKGFEHACQLRSEVGHPCDAAIKQMIYDAFDHAQLPSNHTPLFSEWKSRG